MFHKTHGTAASKWICLAPARDAGKANFYQFLGIVIMSAKILVVLGFLWAGLK